MKRNLLVYLTVFCSVILFSCKKSSTSTTSANLDAGKSSIAFTSNPAFAGSTSYNVSNTNLTHAITATNSGVRVVTLTTTELSGTNTRNAVLAIYLPDNASTSSGNITTNFNLSSGSTYPTFALSSTTGGSSGPSYVATDGVVTITKLTSTEIAGTFAATMDDGGSSTLTLTSGSFAGKF
jgi:hypothetical protein